LVLDPAVVHDHGLAAGPGYRSASGVGLESAGLDEAASVVADLGKDPGTKYRAQPGHASNDLRVWMCLEMRDRRRRELLSVDSRGVEAQACLLTRSDDFPSGTGLTAAIALCRVGCDVLVLERSKAFGEVGAGLQLGPHATRVLRGLGLGPVPHEIGVQRSSVRFLRWQDDTPLCTWPLAEEMESARGTPAFGLRAAQPTAPPISHRDELSVRFWRIPSPTVRTAPACQRNTRPA
jgi:hypothetical protein